MFKPAPSSLLALLLPLTGALASPAFAQEGPPGADVIDIDDTSIKGDPNRLTRELLRQGPAEEDLVLAAQKILTTIQEAPSVITVITRQQMQERGYRTINDALRHVPGFEGDRWEANGWQKESFARGHAQTILVLLNGVNIVEPIRNTVTLDRKIPLEMVERLEVTSGPGGVLWGNNALLGVINIVTRKVDEDRFIATIGMGDGPGERLAIKGSLGFTKRLSKDIGLYAHVDIFSSNGPELRVDVQKVLGSLPAPSPDSPSLYLLEPATISTGKRSFWFNAMGRLEAGDFALEWMIPLEAEYRALATGGASVRHDYLRGESDTGEATLGRDSIRTLIGSFSRRLLEDRLGINARLYGVMWEVNESPFGVYPASSLVLAQLGHTQDIHISLKADRINRAGAAMDFDYRFHPTFRLLFGAEGYADILQGFRQTSWAKDELGVCSPGYTYDPFDAYLPCRVSELQINDTTRFTAGGFISGDWKPTDRLALNAGLRYQFSDQYGSAFLYSGGAVFRVGESTYLKAFASSGLRPPSILSTSVNPNMASGVSFEPNPDLAAETSHSFEFGGASTFLQDVGPLRDVFLRVNGSYTLLNNIIGRPAGRYQNSEARQVLSAETSLRARFNAGHELWAAYTWTQVNDDSLPNGRLENFGEHLASIGGRLSFFEDTLELSAALSVKSAMKDMNRPAIYDPSRPDYSLTCAAINGGALPSDDPMRQVCNMPGMDNGLWVMEDWEVMERIAPLTLLDVSIRLKNIWRDLTLAIHAKNLLDFRYYEPDFFYDARVISRPQPKPGFSIFGQLTMGL